MSASRLALVGIALAGAVVAFGLMAGQGWLDGADHALFDRLAALRAWPDPWLILTRLGDAIPRIPFGIAVALLLWWRGDRFAALLLPAAMLAEAGATSLLKLGFGRARPDLLPQLDLVTSASYPSGHAAHNALLWLLAAALLVPGRPLAIVAAFLFALLIGISRIVLGVHWPSDVAGGLAFGSAAALLALSVRRKSGTM